ncbi:MAG: glycine zipper 2TM domain-containing protein [Alphaproteobacteria bacterium]|nr:glycine zipper 2TM domain-containing protein [Alphaproteobacteria bacterium]
MLTKLMTSAAAALMLLGAAGTAEARDRYDCGYNRNNEAAGAIAGAIIGGVIGNRVFRGERGLGTVGGAILGGVAGSQLARSGDDCDRYYASNAYYDAFEHRRPYERVRWENPRSRNYGYIVPADYYRDRNGRQCRNYEQEIWVNGHREIAEGTACRTRDGTWRIID